METFKGITLNNTDEYVIHTVEDGNESSMLLTDKEVAEFLYHLVGAANVG